MACAKGARYRGNVSLHLMRMHGSHACIPSPLLRMSVLAMLILAAHGGRPAAAQSSDETSVAQLGGLSLEDLANIEVSSVSKSLEPLSDAAASIYVITHDDIIRSGATTLPEMLRLAPNLQVAQISAQSYAISARGFNLYGADKLLVLIDGRSVYTPFFAGVFWDEQNVPPEDIDRIEVISGPGATLWGANAVNGVINIITRKSSDTQGGLVDLGAGNLLDRALAQYGGKIDANTTYRAYGEGFEERHDELLGAGSAMDGLRREQGGFRVDWSKTPDLITVQGDVYQNPEQQLDAQSDLITGRNLLARWTHQFDGGSSLQLQTYYDYSARLVSSDAGGDRLNVYDVDLQDSIPWGRQNIVWGGGYRIEQDEFNDDLAAVPALFFNPAIATLDRSNAFVQDTVTVTDSFKVTAGIKLEKDAYVPLIPLPSIRAAWKITDTNLLWAAISRASRAPSREDRDLDEAIEIVKPPIFLLTNGEFQSEKLIAYELGYRAQPLSRLTFSVSTFYNVYQDLRSVQPTTAIVIPLVYGNDMEGSTYGIEAWATYQLMSWWRLSAGFNLLRENLQFKPGTGDLAGISSAGDDPHHQAQLRSSIDINPKVTFDADLREVGTLPNPYVAKYIELGARIGWKAANHLTLSLTGANLLQAHHIEFVVPPTEVEIGRSFFLNAQITF
jgi:iron complex outermembrane recepter protein